MATDLEDEDEQGVTERFPSWAPAEANLAATEIFEAYPALGDSQTSAPEDLVGMRLTLRVHQARFSQRFDVPVERIRAPWRNCSLRPPETAIPFFGTAVAATPKAGSD